jgi:CBS domain-containing protein
MATVKRILERKGNHCWTIKPDSTVYDALVILSEKQIGSVLVVDNNDKLLGIFTERDYARKLVLKGHSSKESKVKEYMSTDLKVVSPDTPIIECMEIMTEKRFRHLPVLMNNKLCGIISIGDIVNQIIQSQKTTIDDLQNYISGSGYGY